MMPTPGYRDYYDANSWVQGQGKGKPIRSWKACCNTWQIRERNGEFSTPRRPGDAVPVSPNRRDKDEEW